MNWNCNSAEFIYMCWWLKVEHASKCLKKFKVLWDFFLCYCNKIQEKWAQRSICVGRKVMRKCAGHLFQIFLSCTGMFESADRCCREHDHCQHNIPAFTVNYGVFNPKFFTVSHCDCDQRWASEHTPRASNTESGCQVFIASRETPATSNSNLPLTCPP